MNHSCSPTAAPGLRQYRIARQRHHDHIMDCILHQGSALMQELYPPELCYLVDAETLIRDGYEFYMLWENADLHPSGSIALACHRDFAEIKRFYIVASHRGHGYGKCLMRFVIRRACELGFREIRLEVGTRQPEAIRLYERLGFHEISPYPPYSAHFLSRFFARSLNPSLSVSL